MDPVHNSRPMLTIYRELIDTLPKEEQELLNEDIKDITEVEINKILDEFKSHKLPLKLFINMTLL